MGQTLELIYYLTRDLPFTTVRNLTGRSNAIVTDSSKHFGESTTGAYTQAIECSWKVLKTKIVQKMYGTSINTLPRNLIEH